MAHAMIGQECYTAMPTEEFISHHNKWDFIVDDDLYANSVMQYSSVKTGKVIWEEKVCLTARSVLAILRVFDGQPVTRIGLFKCWFSDCGLEAFDRVLRDPICANLLQLSVSDCCLTCRQAVRICSVLTDRGCTSLTDLSLNVTGPEDRRQHFAVVLGRLLVRQPRLRRLHVDGTYEYSNTGKVFVRLASAPAFAMPSSLPLQRLIELCAQQIHT